MIVPVPQNPEIVVVNASDLAPIIAPPLQASDSLSGAKISISLSMLDNGTTNSLSKHNLYHSSASTNVGLDAIVVGESREKCHVGKTAHVLERVEYIATRQFSDMNSNTALVKRSIQYHSRVLILSMILVRNLVDVFSFSLDVNTTHLLVSESYSSDTFNYSHLDGTPCPVTQTSFDSRLDFVDLLNVEPESIPKGKNIQFQIECCSQSESIFPALLEANFNALLVLDDGDAAKFLGEIQKQELKLMYKQWVYLMALMIIKTGNIREHDQLLKMDLNPNCSNAHDFIICIQNINLDNQFFIFNQSTVFLVNIRILKHWCKSF